MSDFLFFINFLILSGRFFYVGSACSGWDSHQSCIQTRMFFIRLGSVFFSNVFYTRMIRLYARTVRQDIFCRPAKTATAEHP